MSASEMLSPSAGGASARELRMDRCEGMGAAIGAMAVVFGALEALENHPTNAGDN